MKKYITILHSNDLHADLLSEQKEDLAIGGMELLSGFIKAHRDKHANTFYFVAGDALQGTLIDNLFLGFPAIESLNRLQPDVFTIGNHELDYGLKHTLLLEKIADFPMINANIVLKHSNKRLFKSHIILERDNLKILVIGILTEEVKSKIHGDEFLRNFIDIQNPFDSIESICNTYKNEDIDLTVLLTHIGLEADIELAKRLKPEWGVDIIIGGHSHSLIDEPIVENGVLIVHAGQGSDRIGELRLEIDRDMNIISKHSWEMRPIQSDSAQPDEQMRAILKFYQNQIDDQYYKRIGYLGCDHTHPFRHKETTLGNLFCDAVRFGTGADLVAFASGSIRTEILRKEVLKSHLMEAMPYDDTLYEVKLNGYKLIYLIELAYTHSERHFLQLSEGAKIKFDPINKKIKSFSLHGDTIDSDKIYKIILQDYQKTKLFELISESAAISIDDIMITKSSITSIRSIISEYIQSFPMMHKVIEERIVFI